MRFSLTITGVAERNLNKLTEDGRSKADVLRSALALEKLYQEVLARGARLIIKEADGSEAEVIRA